MPSFIQVNAKGFKALRAKNQAKTKRKLPAAPQWCSVPDGWEIFAVFMPILRFLAVLALGASLAACSPIVDQRGHVKEPDWKDRIIIGTTTKEGVEQALGSPSSVSTFGNETWYYIATRKETTAFFKPEVVAQDITRIEFSAEGLVARVETVDEAQARKDFEFTKRTTPTEGHSLTMLEQLLGNLGRFNSPTSTAHSGTMGRR